MPTKPAAIVFPLVVLVTVGGLGLRLWSVLAPSAEEGEARAAAPVEVAGVERGEIELRRVFSGTLEAAESFRVAPKVGGRLALLGVDLADVVSNGDVVAQLDGAEFEQAVAQAEAELVVAEATLAEARSGLEIAERALERQSALRERGVASDVQFDVARADSLAAQARLHVAEANVQRAGSVLETARIRRSYTQVRATWNPSGGRRVVARRWANEGDTVAATTPLLTIVQLDPIRAVLFVTERDYARLGSGQTVWLTTDAFPGQRFEGEVARVSPVFESASRQARVELSVPNPDGLLKPGMFVRAEAVLERVDDATIVPSAAVTTRGDRPVVFLLDEKAQTVELVAVEPGIRDGDRTQLLSPALTGRVVTLGQQLLDDGSPVAVASDNEPGGSAEADGGVAAGADAP